MHVSILQGSVVEPESRLSGLESMQVLELCKEWFTVFACECYQILGSQLDGGQVPLLTTSIVCGIAFGTKFGSEQ